MWECNCKQQNSSCYDICQKCNQKMPQRERNRIYKKRLAFARTALGIDYLAPLEKFARKYIGDDTITVEKLSSAFFQLLNIVRKWFVKHKKGVIAALCIYFVYLSLISASSYQNRQIRSYTHQVSVQNSKMFFTHMSDKIEDSAKNAKYFFNTSQTENISDAKQNFNQKIGVLKGNFEIVKGYTSEYTAVAVDFIKTKLKEISK